MGLRDSVVLLGACGVFVSFLALGSAVAERPPRVEVSPPEAVASPDSHASAELARLAWSGDGLDPDLVAEVDESLSDRQGALLGLLHDVLQHKDSSGLDEVSRELDRDDDHATSELVERCGERWPEYLLAALARRAAGTEPSLQMWSVESQDHLRNPEALLLSRPAGSLDEPLRRLLLDPATPQGLWFQCLTAACRAESPSLFGPLVDVALDPRFGRDRRVGVLVRLYRFDRPLPARLHEALYLPFGWMDHFVAAALAADGQPAAISLFRSCAERWAHTQRDETRLVARGLIALGSDDPATIAAAERVLEVTKGRSSGLPPSREERGAAIDVMLEHLDPLIERHPEWQETRFEVDRRAIRARAAARALPEDVSEADLASRLAAGEVDLAAVLVRAKNASSPAVLERLERLAVFLEREIDGSTDPDVVLPILRRRLHGPLELWFRAGVDGLAYSLRDVLFYHCGNCLGQSTLWRVLARRLGLPIHVVELPTHVLLRWDDGERVLLLEPTERSRELSFEDYRERMPLQFADGAGPSVLERPMSDRALVAAHLQSDAIDRLHNQGYKSTPEYMPQRYAGAMRACRDALVWDPANLLAATTWLEASSLGGESPEPAAIEVVEQHAARTDLAPHEHLALIRAFTYLERDDRVAEQLRALEPYVEHEEVRALLDAFAEDD